MNKMNKINVDDIISLPNAYPDDFLEFYNQNKDNISKLPNIKSNNGRCLAVMLYYKNCYWTREETETFCKKFQLKTDDSIQLFNKKSQLGIECSTERGKYYIVYPYKTTNKYKMRKNFQWDGSEESKNQAINDIKSHIQENYINISNDKWQLGHRNPDIEDNTNNNLVLQPPIQARYRDEYIFEDTLTKIPTPKKLKKMIEMGQSPYSKSQLIELKNLLNSQNLDL